MNDKLSTPMSEETFMITLTMLGFERDRQVSTNRTYYLLRKLNCTILYCRENSKLSIYGNNTDPAYTLDVNTPKKRYTALRLIQEEPNYG